MDAAIATIIAGIIGAVGGLIGGGFGGRIGAKATLRAVKESHKQRLELESQKQNETISSVLLGIRAEIKAVWDRYEQEFGPLIEQVQKGEALSVHYPVHQNYFTVYESNCSLIGQISDQKLVEEIVITYTTAKSILDTHTLNNQLLTELKKLQQQSSLWMDDQMRVERAENELRQYAEYFVMYYEDMKARVPQLVDRINRAVRLIEEHSTRGLNSSQTLQR